MLKFEGIKKFDIKKLYGSDKLSRDFLIISQMICTLKKNQN